MNYKESYLHLFQQYSAINDAIEQCQCAAEEAYLCTTGDTDEVYQRPCELMQRLDAEIRKMLTQSTDLSYPSGGVPPPAKREY